jgi:hypothetical protein
MNKQQLEAEVVRLQGEILRRDRIIRVCYYRVQQIRDVRQAKLLEEMQEWAPQSPWVKLRTYSEKGAL